MEEKKIMFKDLSLWLKIAIVAALIGGALDLLAFMAGFFMGY